MSLLSDLLVKVEYNLRFRKNLTEDRINLFLNKIKEKYKNNVIWNPIVKVIKKEKKVNREKLLKQWEKHYKDLSKNTGQFVFKTNKKEIDDRHEYGRTLLHKAVINKDKKEIKKLFLKGIDYNIRDNGGLTPLQIAVIEEDSEIINFLKSLGIT